MGRREIIVTGLFSLLALGGGAVVTSLSTTKNIYTQYLLSLGWVGLVGSVIGLAYMFRTAPKKAAIAAQILLEGPPPRDFLDDSITASVLREKVKNRTSVQIDALTKMYDKKWMKIDGRIRDVSKISDQLFFAQIQASDDSFNVVGVLFRKEWFDQLSALNVGDWVSVIGQITRLHSGPSLENGEILNIGQPPIKKRPARQNTKKKPAAEPSKVTTK